MSDQDSCIVCHELIPDDGKFMKCSECNHCYHLGQTCSGIASGTFTTMGQAKRDAWVCKTCRSVKKRQGPSSQYDGSQAGDSSCSESALLSELREIRKSLESLPELHAKVDSLLLLRTEFVGLSKHVQELQESVEFTSKQYDTILDQVKANQQQMSKGEEEIDALKKTVFEQAMQIQRLQEDQNESEQYSRRANLEIHGLPFEKDEDLKDELSKLAVALKLPNFSLSDVLAIHRLPCKRDTVPVVLVRFASLSVKESWSAARGSLRQLHQSGALPKLFFNDNLTKFNRDLFWHARTAAKDKGYLFAWVKTGKIYVKKTEDAPLLRISKLSDIAKIQ
ncbi:hypothetical protein HPB48_020620 [Haemaphysalis longicornis]|uniref:Zinc finger PHD-type domain-containing protein n=1 Tax=Haemaphysalis longicornis TaxID=44386 RepID=A0A9J6GHU6_HAELO|nr:hypothetical protein HPB48_020620 [Haemaphysalis longicornis]